MQVSITTPGAAFYDLITNKDKPLVEVVKAVKNKFYRQLMLDYKQDLANMNVVDNSDMLASYPSGQVLQILRGSHWFIYISHMRKWHKNKKIKI
jgi:hypothetical protein